MLDRSLALATLLGLTALGCGGSSKDYFKERPASGRAGASATIDVGANGPSGADPGAPSASGGNGETCASANFDGCVGETFEGEALTLDIYIMFDQSGSMASDVGGMTRLQAVERAAESFLNDQESANIGIGIGYFGFLPVGQVSCDAASYQTPDVGITREHSRVIASLDAREPVGETPTAAAISGACGYATEFRRQNPSHAVVLLLVTDGIPEAPASCATGGCCPSLGDAVAAASACGRNGAGIKTYVLGVGPALDNLDQIAAAGGTNKAYLVGDQDVSRNVLDALDSIRGAAIPCELEIPTGNAGQSLDYSEVNVLIGNRDCSAPLSPIYYVNDETSCDASSGGWYYDDPDAPTLVKLCAASCAAVSDPDATLRFSVGCHSLPPPPR